MENYNIEEKITVNQNIQIFLLNLKKNVDNIDYSIIPISQIKKISSYTNIKDLNKKLLARSFLFQFLYKNYGFENFDVKFNQYKKPYFSQKNKEIQFSFSYSKEYILIAISSYKDIGVDIEYIDPYLAIEEMCSDEIFCQSELVEINLLNNPIKKRKKFFQIFSAKESLIKAFGEGFYFKANTLDTINNKFYLYKDSKFYYKNLGIWQNNYSIAASYKL